MDHATDPRGGSGGSKPAAAAATAAKPSRPTVSLFRGGVLLLGAFALVAMSGGVGQSIARDLKDSRKGGLGIALQADGFAGNVPDERRPRRRTGQQQHQGADKRASLDEKAWSRSATAGSSGTPADGTSKDGLCSCLRRGAADDDSPSSCCQRAVLRDHKFGYILTKSLFHKFGERIELGGITPRYFPADPLRDYRHVAVTRNFFEAFVSGYLYHKSGSECWLTFRGRNRTGVEQTMGWERVLNQSKYVDDVAPYPPRNGRSICRYLADESEEVGMKVYIAFALQRHYIDIDDYYRMARERQVRDERQRTLFLCMEDYPDGPSEDRLFYQAMDWMYPGGHNFTVPPMAVKDDPTHGGHASSHDPSERVRLLELVKRLDREVFRGAISVTDSHLGCRGTIHRRRAR